MSRLSLARFVVRGALMLSLLTVPAAAQIVGVRAGVSAHPEQFYFGGHVRAPPLLDQLHFQPSIEIGLGDEVALGSLNIEFIYLFPTSKAWAPYAGGGPALNVIHNPGGTRAEPGFSLLGGVTHVGGVFAELKVGALYSPRTRFCVGYSWLWQ